MKNATILFLAFAGIVICLNLNAQVTALTNNSNTATDFLGWSPTVTFALNLNHKANTAASDINFLTRNTQRMVLDDNGRLGLGLANPSALLHLGRTTSSLGNLFRTDGLTTEVTQWQLFTGATVGAATERFRLYAEAAATPWIGLQSLSNGLRFETAGAFQRMRINGSQTTASINGFNNINTTGFVGLSPSGSLWVNAGPHTALHIMDEAVNGPLTLGYRNWMRIGTTYSTNSDFCYMGLRKIGTTDDVTETVVAFGDNGDFGAIGPDQMVIRFVNGTGTDVIGAGSADGLELIRFSGVGQGRVAIGDEFNHTSLALQPQRRLHVHDPGTNNELNSQLRISYALSDITPICTDFRTTSNGNLYINSYGNQQRVGIEEASPLERLDVNGNARFQNIPSVTPNCIIMGSNITAGVAQDNRLTRLDLNNNPNTFLAGNGTWQAVQTLCDWNLLTNGTSDDLVMGYTGACNEGRVGIGTNNPSAKLTLINNLNGGSGNSVLIESTNVGSATNFGLFSQAQGGSLGIVGVNGLALASGPGELPGFTPLIGVRGIADAQSQCFYQAIGVYGQAIAGSSCGTSWAGYFAGNVATNGNIINISDETLKQNIVDQPSALEGILNLHPTCYEFRTEEYPSMGLSEGTHHGLLAQEVAQVFPNLVKDVSFPAEVGSSGESLDGAMDLKGVNYIELIPILIKGMQEQQSQIRALEIQLASCCTASNPIDEQRSLIPVESQNVTLINRSIILNQNTPNPFAQQTTINYFIEQDFNKAQIMFYDINGKLMQVTELAEKGSGQLHVFAEDLTSGIYSYVLVVDGQIIDSKKMMKK